MVLLFIPRALPPVTHSKAFQAYNLRFLYTFAGIRGQAMSFRVAVKHIETSFSCRFSPEPITLHSVLEEVDRTNWFLKLINRRHPAPSS